MHTIIPIRRTPPTLQECLDLIGDCYASMLEGGPEDARLSELALPHFKRAFVATCSGASVIAQRELDRAAMAIADGCGFGGMGGAA